MSCIKHNGFSCLPHRCFKPQVMIFQLSYVYDCTLHGLTYFGHPCHGQVEFFNVRVNHRHETTLFVVILSDWTPLLCSGVHV